MKLSELPHDLVVKIAQMLESNADRLALEGSCRGLQRQMRDYPWGAREYPGLAPLRTPAPANAAQWRAMMRERFELRATAQDFARVTHRYSLSKTASTSEPHGLQDVCKSFNRSKLPERVLATLTKSTPHAWACHREFRRALTLQRRGEQTYPFDEAISLRAQYHDHILHCDAQAACQMVQGGVRLDSGLVRIRHQPTSQLGEHEFWETFCQSLSQHQAVSCLEQIVATGTRTRALIALRHLAPASESLLQTFASNGHPEHIEAVLDHGKKFGLVATMAYALRWVVQLSQSTAPQQRWSIKTLDSLHLPAAAILAAEQTVLPGEPPQLRPGLFQLVRADRAQPDGGAKNPASTSAKDKARAALVRFYANHGLDPIVDTNPDLRLRPTKVMQMGEERWMADGSRQKTTRLSVTTVILSEQAATLMALEQTGFRLSTAQVIFELFERPLNACPHRRADRLSMLKDAGLWRPQGKRSIEQFTAATLAQMGHRPAAKRTKIAAGEDAELGSSQMAPAAPNHARKHINQTGPGSRQ